MALNDETKLAVLAELANAIAERREVEPGTSYTAKLISRGVEKCAQKTGEEAVEFVIAAVSGQAAEISQEAADLLYHFLVTLEVTGVSLDQVLIELERRRGVGGLDEKASRPAR